MTEEIVSILVQGPAGAPAEEPKEGCFPDAGFSIVVAGQRRDNDHMIGGDTHG